MSTVAPLVIDQGAIDETRAWLRIEHHDEDGLIEGLLHASILLGEAYIGQLMIRRGVIERMPGTGQWQRLRQRPVFAIGSVARVEDSGAVSALGADEYGVDIDPAGDGWVRQRGGIGTDRLEVAYEAGMATGWADVPDPLRQGVIRLAAHGFTHRDDANDDGPPAAVTALWRPWRRMTL